MSTDRVMLLIDADNVSVDVMEQAIASIPPPTKPSSSQHTTGRVRLSEGDTDFNENRHSEKASFLNA